MLTSSATDLAAVTTEGRALVFQGIEAVDASGRARGSDAAQLLGLNRGEEVLDLVAPGDEHLVLITTAGVAKRLTTDEVLSTKSGKDPHRAQEQRSGRGRVPSPREGRHRHRCVRRPDPAAPPRLGQRPGQVAGGVAGMKLKRGATVVGAGALIGDGVVITVTSERGAKATPYGELPVKGRGGQGVRIARLADGETITLIYSGSPDSGLLAQMADDDDPKKLDPNPVPFEIEATNRDLVPVRTNRQVRVLAPGRW